MRLETKRLLLCEWQEGDTDLLWPIAQDPRVMRHITGGAPWSQEEVREFVARQMAHMERYGFCYWKLFLREADEMIGFCGVQPLAQSDEFEVGWWLAGRHWGQGYATEAARRAVEFAFSDAGLQKVVGVVMPDNERSIAVLNRLGMRCVGPYAHKGLDLLKYELRHP